MNLSGPSTLALQRDFDLCALNSFGFPSRAEYFLRVETLDQLRQAVALARKQGWPMLMLGGGSNLVLREHIPGLVIQMALKGRQVASPEAGTVLVSAAAGENWHETVVWTLQQGCYGLENLALIPGTVGAAPMQNIGAYGVELEERFDSLLALDTESGDIRRFDRDDCRFGYRDSLFKSVAPGRYIILEVTFALSQRPCPVLRYQALADALALRGLTAPDPEQVFEAICEIRRRKLPDPAVVGNAGSFFKNPLVSSAQCEALRERFPGLVAFAAGDGCKLAAGWLIDQCGWKGRRLGQVGVYHQQALVLVNEGGGTAAELLQLSDRIRGSVRERFGVELEMEPRLYPA
ncbi:UDP-N-acetylmuramate dehydrogenase [Marinobacterium aestuariivivens]|uniref:UDP-N-acetylenolpyruvoylglucosamine reductase n=1 Tax=Marinobacterium aestuariivivens TaxID=1698799 RepID=A0ABW2A5M0_9GAMM